MKFYKDRYIIAFYDEDDNLVDLFDNISELAKATSRTYKDWSCKFCDTDLYFDGEVRKGRKSVRTVKFNGAKCRIHLISAI